MPSPPDSPSTFPRLVGRAVERVEDAALLTGRGRFADDVGERPGTAHAAVLRSPHAHAEIVSLDAAAALSMPEVVTVLTGEEVAAWSRPFIAGVKQPMRHYAFAVDRVRYTGEPVAVVVARDRYAAEDALERIEVEYRELDPVVDPVAAAAPGAHAAAPRRRLERRERPALPLRRPRRCVRERRAPGGDLGALSAQCVHPDRGVRRRPALHWTRPGVPGLRNGASARHGDRACVWRHRRSASRPASTRCLAASARSDSPGFVFTPLPPDRPTRSALRSAGNP